MSHTISLQPPSHIRTSNLNNYTAFTPPTLPFLTGTWHITHSTLPMWSSKRNVRITYTPLPSPPTPASSTTNIHQPSTPSSQLQKLDDLVQYQSLTSATLKTVHGIDTPSGTDASAWNWRGKGFLMIASSHWEILGWGEYSLTNTNSTDGSVVSDGEGEEKGQWMLTYFASTLFTPAGIDIYSRAKEGLPSDLIEGIKAALGRIEDVSIGKLVGKIFEIVHD